MQHGKDDIIFDTLVPEGSKDIGEGGKEGGGGVRARYIKVYIYLDYSTCYRSKLVPHHQLYITPPQPTTRGWALL